MKKKFTVLMICFALALLTGCGGAGKENAPAQAAEGSAEQYRVIVKDEQGKPVQGVMVQLCSDQACQMGETDADGIAAYPETPEGTYTVHIYSVPEGYAEDTTEYTAPETYGDIEVTLIAAP